MAPHGQKKSETIEIRLSHEAKTAFMARCRDEQRTASDAIRLFIDHAIEAKPAPRRLPHWRMVAAAVVGVGMGAAAPSLAHANQTSRASFDQIDRNHDGVIDYAEFHAR